MIDYHYVIPNRHIRAISVRCSVRFRTRESRGLKRGFLVRNILTEAGCLGVFRTNITDITEVKRKRKQKLGKISALRRQILRKSLRSLRVQGVQEY